MPTFINQGCSSHYEEHGTGRSVLFLHGLAVSFTGNFVVFGWVDQFLAKGYQVIGLDFRGHGWSEKPRSPWAYGTRNLGDDVLALLTHLEIFKVSLIGVPVLVETMRFLADTPGP